MLYEKEKRKGNAKLATLAVARKLVDYVMAVECGQRVFVSSGRATVLQRKLRYFSARSRQVSLKTDRHLLKLPSRVAL
jgi:hypothetical protein